VRRLGTGLIALIFWLAIWQFAAMAVDQELLLVSPGSAAAALLGELRSASCYLAVLHSLRNIVLGFVLALVLGFSFAYLSYFVRPIGVVLHPFVKFMRVVLVASLTILALAFVSSRWLPMYVAILMVLPMVYLNVWRGLHETDPELLEMSRVFRVPMWRQIGRLYFPTTLPFFFAAYETGFGYAWKSAVTAEVIASATGSIGANLSDAKIYFDMPSLFAWTLTIIVVSLATEKVVVAAIAPLRRRHARVMPHD
jgi:NitT/TauT family transport system permease protein